MLLESALRLRRIGITVDLKIGRESEIQPIQTVNLHLVEVEDMFLVSDGIRVCYLVALGTPFKMSATGFGDKLGSSHFMRFP